MINPLSKLGIEGNFLIKSYKKLIPNIKLSDKKLDVFPRSETKKRYPQKTPV